MSMNLAHRVLCSSQRWSDTVARHLPRSLEGVDLGDNVLEIGPGFGATTRALVDLVPRLTSIEIDETSVRRLRAEFGERVQILHGDGTQLPFPDRSYSAVVCFTMLHHVPSPALQDRLFAEARRVLRPGGVFGAWTASPASGSGCCTSATPWSCWTPRLCRPAHLGRADRRQGHHHAWSACVPRPRARLAERRSEAPH